EIVRRVPLDVEILVSYKIRPRRRAEAAWLDGLRVDRGMVIGRAPALKEGADAVREPKCCEDLAHGPGQARRKAAFGNHQWDILGHAIFSPDLQDVLHQLRLLIQTLPGDVAALERIVFEGDESQVAEAAVRLQ